MTSEFWQKRKRAIELLTYYFKSTRVASGLSWDEDNDVEVEEIVSAIIDAATANVRVDNILERREWIDASGKF